MSGNEIALDTNEAIAVLNDAGDAGRWAAGFLTVYLPVPVVGELRFGALNSRRSDENRQRIEGLVKHCTVLDANEATAQVYAAVRLRLKRAGRPIPENDVWIAALCLQHGLPLATSDAHLGYGECLDDIPRLPGGS